MSHDVIKKHSVRANSLRQAAKDAFNRPKLQGNASTSRNLNQEDAVYFLYQAHVSWRILQEWEEAADCLEEASEGMWRLGEKHESLMTLSTCAELRERVNPFDSIDIYAKLISMACDLSRYKEAGRYQLRIAELCEEGRNYEDAITAYRDAARFYSAEMLTQEAHNCMIKYATICADLEEYDIAYEAMMELAKHCLQANLSKFCAKGFLFRAGMILIAQGETEELKKSLLLFSDLDHGFINARECFFLQAMIDVRNPIDMDKFADDIYDYDAVAPLDSWTIRMLKRFKVFLDQDFEVDKVRKEEERKVKEAAIVQGRKKRFNLARRRKSEADGGGREGRRRSSAAVAAAQGQEEEEDEEALFSGRSQGEEEEEEGAEGGEGETEDGAKGAEGEGVQGGGGEESQEQQDGGEDGSWEEGGGEEGYNQQPILKVEMERDESPRLDR